MVRRAHRWLAALFLVLPLFCAAKDVDIGGVVEDETGRPLAGAEVEVLSPLGMSLARGSTDGRGAFRLRVARPGNYLLEVRAARFQADLRSYGI